MKHGLSDSTVAKIRGVFARFPAIDEALLYGSRAKGNFKRGSDIDLALRGAGLDADTRARIADALDDLPLPYTIDVALYDDIDHAPLREHIDRVGVVFYTREAR